MPAPGVDTDVRYRGCRVVALGRDGSQVLVHFATATAEVYDVTAALLGGEPWSPLAVEGVLEVFLSYVTADMATAEHAVLDHWGETQALLDVTFSAVEQGVLVTEPATGLFTGMRLPPAATTAAAA